MTYLYKLAKRLSAACPASALVVAAFLGASCAPAEDRDLLGTTPATVTPPVAVAISPRAGSVKPGEEVRFSAVGRSVAGGTVPVEVEWQADGGTITADGRFVASQHGQFRVTAKVRQYPHLADSALVAVFNAPTDILLLSVTPDSSLITEGEGIQLLAEARLADGSTSQRPPVRWSATGGRVDGSGWFSSLEPGDYRVEAVSTGGVRGQATILVRPNVRITTSIEVTPSALSLTYGESRQLRAVARFADGSEGQAQVLWSSTGGTIGTDGVFTAGSATGNFRIIARTSSSGIADTTMVSITEPPMRAVRVSPATATLLPGATQQFVATAVLGDGSTRSVGVTWTAAGGSIQANGQFAAGQAAGSYRVIAVVPGTTLADTAVVQVVSPTTVLERVVLNPREARVPLGTSRQFTATGIYADGATRTPPVAWSATGGTISGSGAFTPGTTVGTYHVIATAPGGKADTSVVTVAPAELQQVLLNPSAVTLTPGATRSFSVSGRWSDGSAAAPGVAYQAEGGTITADGMYTAGDQPGTWRLIARQTGGTLADTSLITIEPPAPQLLGVSVSPKTVAVQPGQSVALSVLGRWSTGGSAPPPVTWAATGGQVSPQGVFTAGAVDGSYQVVVRTVDGRHADTSRVSIETAAPTLARVVLTPRQTALQTGGTRQFYASGTLSDGSATVPAVTWSATGGTITNGGLYVASVAGTHRIIATQQGGRLADTATVTVSDPLVLAGVQVTPDSAVVQAGESLTFAALGVWSNGATGNTAVTWSTTGGTISSAGVFTAGSVAGTYLVIARATAAAVADTVVVRVQASPTVARLWVSPATGNVAAGATLQFAAEATYSDGAVRPATITWAATGGTITPAGLYTAGAAGGIFRVIATSGTVADTAAVTVTVAPVVTRFVLSPDSVTLTPSGTQQFSTAVTWSDGATRTVSVTYSATGGTVSSTGNYVAGSTAGRFLVVALCACGTVDTSVVTVAAAAPTLTALRIAPDTTELAGGERVQFRVTGTLSDGSTSSPAVTWVATGGTVDAQGAYTAPSVAGVHTVTATHAGSGLRATAVARVTAAPEVGTEVLPELPRVYLNTRYTAPTGRTIRVPEGGNLQAALDAAQPGDEILLAPRAEYRGSFWLRRKAGTGWITLRTDTQLPPEGVRVTPATAVNFAKLVATSGGSASPLRTENGASYYRIMGLEVTAGTTLTNLTALVRIQADGAPVTSLEQLPAHIILDRVYLHGHSRLNLGRCVALNAIAGAVVDSYLSECHHASADAQAIWTANGPGPFKIVNNYLAGSGENVMFGGADPSIVGLVPSDIEIRRNHFHKPLAWRDVWLVKNLFELKNAQRVLVEDNVFENSWKDGQTGMAFNLKTASQDDRAPWTITADVTIRYNVIRNAEWAASIAARPTGVGQPARRIRLENNLFLDMGGWYIFGLNSGAEGSGVALRDVQILNNTIITREVGQGLIIPSGREKATGIIVRGNIAPLGRYGVKGGGTTSGLNTFNGYWSSYVFAGNGLVGAQANSSYPDNFWADTFAAGGIDEATGLLASHSPFGAGPGRSRALGAPAAEVASRTQGVVQP